MKLDIGRCSGCNSETRRESEDHDHWWHVGVKPMLTCLWRMVASSEYRPEFILVEADVDTSTILRTVPRQRKTKSETVPVRI